MMSIFIPPAALVAGLYPQNTGSFFTENQVLVNGAAPGTADNPNINFQVTIEERHSDTMEIVDHPIEQGAPITDHSFKRPAEVVLHLGWTAPQLLELAADASQEQYLNGLAQVYDQLLQGQANRVLYTVNTAKRVYQDMLIKDITTMSDKETRNVLLITVAMRQLLLVSAQIVTVAAPQNQQQFPPKTNPDTPRSRQAFTTASTFKPVTP